MLLPAWHPRLLHKWAVDAQKVMLHIVKATLAVLTQYISPRVAATRDLTV
jgi:hypothetical protein